MNLRCFLIVLFLAGEVLGEGFVNGVQRKAVCTEVIEVLEAQGYEVNSQTKIFCFYKSKIVTRTLGGEKFFFLQGPPLEGHCAVKEVSQRKFEIRYCSYDPFP